MWISRFPDRLRGLKAPGPGPASNLLDPPKARYGMRSQRTALALSSTRAYVREYKRMVHARVARCKKRWTKPSFSKQVKVRCGKKQKLVRSGTQIIDGVWRLLRKGKWWTWSSSEHDLNQVGAVEVLVPWPRPLPLLGQRLQKYLLIWLGASISRVGPWRTYAHRGAVKHIQKGVAHPSAEHECTQIHTQ